MNAAAELLQSHHVVQKVPGVTHLPHGRQKEQHYCIRTLRDRGNFAGLSCVVSFDFSSQVQPQKAWVHAACDEPNALANPTCQPSGHDGTDKYCKYWANVDAGNIESLEARSCRSLDCVPGHAMGAVASRGFEPMQRGKLCAGAKSVLLWRRQATGPRGIEDGGYCKLTG